MPGGSRYRQWYAMRNRLRAEGRWQANPTHTVPAQEEGEPPAQRPRTESPEGASTPESLPELESSPTDEGIMSYNGFSVLAWVKDDCRMLQDISSDEGRAVVKRQLLLDFNTLIGMRWNMEMQLVNHGGTQYAYGNNTRFSVGDRTLRNALGNLANHVDFIRGTHHASPEDLANYKVCKEKWKVPENVADSSSGWEATGPAETSPTTKRPRY